MRTLVLTGLLAWSQTAGAAFLDWWLTPDQQGRIYYERGDYAQSAQRFTDPLWKGLAYYAAQDFVSAAALFDTLDTPEGRFYLGNALAQQDRLADAVRAYEEALVLRPDFPEAAYNLDWVQGLLEIDERVYDDAGGTGGKLQADEFVFDDKAKNAQQTMTDEQARAQGLSDEQLQALWMRRVQTTPGDFLALKFAYQLQDREASE